MPEDHARTIVRFDCPTCDARLRAAIGLSGRRLRCPRCSEPVLVPPFQPNPSDTAEVLACAPTVYGVPGLPQDAG